MCEKSNCFVRLALFLLAGTMICSAGKTLSAQSTLEALDSELSSVEFGPQNDSWLSSSLGDNEAASLWATQPDNSFVAETFDNVAPGQYFASPTAENNAASELWPSLNSSPSIQSQFNENLHRPTEAPVIGRHSDRRVYFGIEALYLIRSGIDGGKFVYDDNGVALNYSDLEPGSSADLRLRWARVDGTGKGTEFVLLKSNGFDERVTVDGPNVFPVFYYSVPASAQDSWDIEMNSDLDSYELNWWGGSQPDLRFGIGGRYVRFQEEFNITNSANTAAGFFSTTDNEMFGVQLLAEYRKWVGNTTLIEAGNRTGLYYNGIDVVASAANGELNRDTNGLAFVGNWNAGLRFHKGLGAWRIGYEAIMLSGVATGPAQSEALRILDPEVGEIVTGTAFYHGVYGGFELMF